MGKSVNQVFLIGRLTRDVELRQTPNGKSVASFSLAVDKQSGDGANFFDVTAWEKLAELVDQYVRKGSKVHVQGTLEQQTWEQDGNKRSKVIVVARDVTFLDTRENTQPAQQTQQIQKPDEVIEDIGDEPINLDDIPF